MSRSGQYILVAERNPEALESLSQLLGRQGFRVLLARDGKELVKKAKEAKPDLIVTGLLAENITTPTRCRQIREEEEMKAIPILIYVQNPPSRGLMFVFSRVCDGVVVRDPRTGNAPLLAEIRRMLQT